MLICNLCILVLLMTHLVVSCPFSRIDCSLPNTISMIAVDREPIWKTYWVVDMIHVHGEVRSFLRCVAIAQARGDIGVSYQSK